MIHHGDCLEVMAAMEPESVDAIATDPPYGLEFMGKEWDKLATILPESGGYNRPGSRAKKSPMDTWGKRPSAYVAGTRAQEWHQRWAEAAYRVAKPSAYLLAFGGTRTVHRMTVALEDAGWIIRDMLVWAYASGFPKSKASLKPAWEPIVMARKPGPLRMLAIDACRIGTEPAYVDRPFQKAAGGLLNVTGEVGVTSGGAGRWPANVILGDALFEPGVPGVVVGGSLTARGRSGGFAMQQGQPVEDVGLGYSRFFVLPKADRTDREPVYNRADPDERHGNLLSDGAATTPGHSMRRNVHPTVKPTELMRHLVRLVTPSGGTVLDPFLGSGTTGLACELEGFPWIGIEKEAEYVAIAEARLNGTQRGLGLSA